jgi:hypothetical protein
MGRGMRFTFKKNQSTGRYASFDDPSYDIKFNKKRVGNISLEKSHTIGPYRVMLMINKKDINEDGNPNCEWRWITFSKRFETIEDAKKWLNDRVDIITSTHNLHFGDER